MPSYVPLDNVAHADVRVRLEYGAPYGNAVNQTVVFPTEFEALHREYPIFFRKSPEGKFLAIVLLGLDKDENLFLQDGAWRARYVPAMQARGPFGLMLPPGTAPDAVAEADPVLQIDMDDPRVIRDEGESVFLPHGGYAPFLEAMLVTLKRLHVGSTVLDRFFSELDQLQLIEPVTVQASFGDTMQYTVPDLFTISRERMKTLSAEELHHLNGLGLLEHCFAIMASFGNVSHLIDLKVRAGGVVS